MVVEEQLKAHCTRDRLAAGLRRCLPYFTFSLCLAVYLYPFLRMFSGSGDEGTLVYGAVRVTEGQVPLRDFFEVIGPGSFYWLALFFKIFGTSVLATHLSVVATSFSTALLMYFLTRRLNTGYDAVPAILFLATSLGGGLPANSHHNDSNLFALLSFTVFLHCIDKRRQLMLCAAGSLAGITTLILQPKGILLFFSFVLLLFLFRDGTKLRSSLGWLAGSYLVVGSVVVSFYWSAGGLTGLIYANVVWPILHYSGVNSVPYGFGVQTLYWQPWTAALKPEVSAPFAFGIASVLIVPYLLVAALPPMGVLFAIYRKRFAPHFSTLPYWIAGAALWLSEIHRKDITHLVYGSPLLIILCLYYLTRGRHKLITFFLRLIGISTFTLAVFNGLIALAAQTKVTSPRGTFYTFQVDPVLEFLNTHVTRGEEIFAYPYCPMYYFLTATRNPTRFSILMYHINTDSQFHDAVRSLEERKVHYVIWDREFSDKAKCGWPKYALPREEYLIVEPYFREHYRLLRRINGVDILERKDDLPEPHLPASAETVMRVSGHDRFVD